MNHDSIIVCGYEESDMSFAGVKSLLQKENILWIGIWTLTSIYVVSWVALQACC